MTTDTQDTPIEFSQGSVKKAMQGMSSADLWKMPPDRLRVADGFNVRDKDSAYNERVRTIANSIIENGYMADKPIAGYVAEEDGEHIIYITDGHTRYDAIQLAISEGHEIVEVPVVTKPRGTSMEDLTVALVTSNSGERLKPLELARVCQRLLGYGMTENTIAKRIGITREYLNQLLDLLAAPKALRDMVSKGTVSATLAIETVKKHGGKGAAKVLKEGVKEAKASGKERVTAKHVKKAVEKANPAPITLDTPTPPLVQKGVAWLTDKGLSEDVNCLLLIAHLSDAEFKDVQAYAVGAYLAATATNDDKQTTLPLDTPDSDDDL